MFMEALEPYNMIDAYKADNVTQTRTIPFKSWHEQLVNRNKGGRFRSVVKP